MKAREDLQCDSDTFKTLAPTHLSLYTCSISKRATSPAEAWLNQSEAGAVPLPKRSCKNVNTVD